MSDVNTWSDEFRKLALTYCIFGVKAPNGNLIGGMRLFDGKYRIGDLYNEPASAWTPGKAPGDSATSGKNFLRNEEWGHVPWEIVDGYPCPGGTEGMRVPGVGKGQWLVSQILDCTYLADSKLTRGGKTKTIKGLHYKV